MQNRRKVSIFFVVAATMGYVKGVLFLGLVVTVYTAPLSLAKTDLRDVAAMNTLYVFLGAPSLQGWVPIGGDPCGEQWQGVSCVFSNITALKLPGMNLGGILDQSLQLFVSIIDIDLSNNQLGGSVPSNLPPTLKSLSLGVNRFDGSIPDDFSLLTQLLTLDLSGNNLTGQLPPSFGNLSSLTTLHLQNNKFTGTLDILQDLPLQDLDVENNLFSGPIPPKLLSIPNFRKDGNPFNTTVIPPPPVAPPPVAIPPSIAPPPSYTGVPGKRASGPSAFDTTKTGSPKEFFTTTRVILVVSVLGMVIILGTCVSIALYCRRKQVKEVVETNKGYMEKPNSKSSFQRYHQEERVPKQPMVKVQERRIGKGPKSHAESDRDPKIMAACPNRGIDCAIDITDSDVDVTLLQPPPPPPFLSVDKVIVNPIIPAEGSTRSHSSESLNSSLVRVFTIAALQQYTNSFSEENFVGEGTLGSVYRAELPGGKLLAVKKLNATASRQQTDEEFLQLVSDMSTIQHANVLEFVGYCNEHGQRLLVHEYCRNGTLHDALHLEDEIHKRLSWNVRIQLALGAARALQYLHEVCQPPIVHRNFRSSNIFLDDKLAAQVSECGLAPLISSGSVGQLSGRVLGAHGYCAPEFELGSYTCKSDIYSFGVVMLELLTGRKSYDRSRTRGEQSLVRWALPQLHDIDALSRMVDRSLNGSYPVKSLSRFADIISRCLQWEPEFRPPISEIVQDLLRMV